MALDDFSGDSESESTGSKRTYTEITQDEFEEFLSELPVEFEKKDYEWAQEWIYEAHSKEGTFTLRIYSSIDKRSGAGRDKGSDAIRTVLLFNNLKTPKPVLKEKRTNRIKTWRKNLRKKVKNMLGQKGNLKRCGECNGIMVIRENQKNGNKFWGCSNWPDCENTDSIDQ